MRSRNIKPGFFKNEFLAECDPLARILFQGLWCMADREGRLEYRPKRIKIEILPYDTCDITELLNQLLKNEFITTYKINGCEYIQILNFTKHQNCHIKESDSTIPAPDKHGASTVQESPLTESLLLNPDTDTDTYSQNSDKVRLANLLFDKILERDGKHKKPNIQTWAKYIDSLIRLDNRSPKEIEEVICWCQCDSFWQNNILSTKKLRDKFSQLTLKKDGNNGRTQGSTGTVRGKTEESQSDGQPYPVDAEF